MGAAVVVVGAAVVVVVVVGAEMFDNTSLTFAYSTINRN